MRMKNKKTLCLDHTFSKVSTSRKSISQMKLGSKIFKCSFLKFPTFLQYLEIKAFSVKFQTFSYKSLQIYKTKK